MTQPDEVRIEHLREAAQKAVDFSRRRSRADLQSDELLRLALTKLVEIVGEAAKQTGEEGRRRYPNVPWAEAARMRDRLVHHYFDIDLDVLWATVTEDLPRLLQVLEKASAGDDGNDPPPRLAAMVAEHPSLAETLPLLAADVAPALGGTRSAWEVIEEEVIGLSWVFDQGDDADWPLVRRIIENVQQRLHDTFIDTVWPRCPRHVNHPMWLREEEPWRWECAEAGIQVPVGELALNPGSTAETDP